MMTPKEMRGYRIEMCLSAEEVAGWLKVPAAALRAYEAGEIELPEVERFWRLIENTKWIRSALAEGRQVETHPTAPMRHGLGSRAGRTQ